MDSQTWVKYVIFLGVPMIISLILAEITVYIALLVYGPFPAAAAAEDEENSAAIAIAIANAKAKKERLVYTTEDVEASGGDCAICLEEYSGGERRATIDACGHRFHAPCIEEWLWSNDTCPLCRHLLV